eukprot:SAG11_NODE_21233_length_429_cov_0.784848_1_plen_25_part_01
MAVPVLAVEKVAIVVEGGDCSAEAR